MQPGKQASLLPALFHQWERINSQPELQPQHPGALLVMLTFLAQPVTAAAVGLFPDIADIGRKLRIDPVVQTQPGLQGAATGADAQVLRFLLPLASSQLFRTRQPHWLAQARR